ncbi:MAG: hypothetical protein Q9164_004755 [Protoblastenia rupestris]
MEWEESSNPTVDPEVRAYVYSLVSALGGRGANEDGRYVLGDEALACLKDLKKWLNLYDQKANRLDVARCLAEANLVKGDLLEILAVWSEAAPESRLKSKIALACIELLVPLTWPMEKNDMQMTVNHHRHVPYLQLAQAAYKRAILEHESATILRTAVRTGLPSIALPMGERTSRDEGIIRLLLYLFRNVAKIAHPQNGPIGDEEEVSRSATIEAFHRQDVLALLLTISSNIGEDFNTQDTVVMEVLFHLVKGVEIERLFMDKKQLSDKNSDELKSLLAQEANMHRSYAKNAPTRHNRFGTMIWVQRDEAGRHSTVSGQDILKDGQKTLSKMDQTKKWNKPKQRSKDDDSTLDRFDMPVPLTESARIHLRSFVEEFLDSSFNPLFNHTRRAIEREADRVLNAHKLQCFYLVSWFLEAERVRRRLQADRRKKDKKLDETFEPDSFGLIATVLTQEFFVLLNRFTQNALDLKLWREVQAGMRCFTQILLVVQDMADSALEEDQEIAENIQNRIFYEETTHDRIIAILRGYKDQGFGYLDTCTELAHVFLRILERYSRENADLQIRSKRRARKTEKAEAKKAGQEDDDEDQVSEMEDIREAERVSKERRFDFMRFSTKFMTQTCINTFVTFVRFYNDLSTEQLKRAHRFFYRVAFKQDQSVMLFRLDIITLFNKIIKGPEGLDPKSPVYGEWDELVRQIIRKLAKKLGQRPELAVELLFSKIPSTTFYLEYGYEKQTTTSQPRAPAALEVRGSMTQEEQIGVVVAILYDNQMDHIQWVTKTLSIAADERQCWEAEIAARQSEPTSQSRNEGERSSAQPPTSKAPSIVITPPSEEIRIAMFKDAKMRLLMTLSGFERLGDEDDPNATWVIPTPLTSNQLRHTLNVIEQHRQDPKFQYGEEDPIPAEDMLRRKPSGNQRRADYDDDSEGDGIVSDGQGEEEFLFPAGGPTNTVDPREKALLALKNKRRKRQSRDDEETGLDDETREARRKARAEADLERRRGIKSAQFVRDSDDESDEERDQDFFAREAARRKGQKERVAEALRAGRVVGRIEGQNVKPTVLDGKKRKNSEVEDREVKKMRASGEISDVDDAISIDDRLSPAPMHSVSASSDENEEYEDTPLSSPPHVAQKKHSGALEASVSPLPSSQSESGGKLSKLALEDQVGRDEDEEGPVAARGRRRPRVAVFDDSDDD